MGRVTADMTEKFTLTKMSDNFTVVNLTNNIYENCKLVYTKIEELYGVVNNMFISDTPQIPQFTKFSGSLNRSAYLWILDSIIRMQSMINNLISQFNVSGLADVLIYNNVNSIKLWVPTSLALNDNYRSHFNDNWDVVEQVLETLMGIILPYANNNANNSDDTDPNDKVIVPVTATPLVFTSLAETPDPGDTNGGTWYENRMWMLTGSATDHATMDGTIELRDRDLYSLRSTIKHNLGHGNGVDVCNNKLLVYNENGGTLEVNIYNHPETKNELNVGDKDNTLITLDGVSMYGSACFGENENVIYHASPNNSNSIIITKINLEFNNDVYSTQSIEWQKQIQVTDDIQPQDMFLDGSMLHVGVGLEVPKDVVFKMSENGAVLMAINKPTLKLGEQELETLFKLDDKIIWRSGKNKKLHIGTTKNYEEE